MVEAVLRARRRKAQERLRLAARWYAGLGWPMCRGAQPRVPVPPQRKPGQAGSGRACSCDRIGCPAPGAHPVSPAWKLQATADVEVVSRWWTESPRATILLVTGRLFDVLDVPAQAGTVALRRLEEKGVAPGPVAVSASDRNLFFVATRATGEDDEWWSCNLDCAPDVIPEVSGLRWHCRDSYVVAPPSPLGSGIAAKWLAEPGARELPDALRLLEVLADACEEITP